jgi:hypothetical protein
MTKIGQAVSGSARVEAYLLLGPVAAAGAVKGTLTQAPSAGWELIAIPLSDLDQTNPFSNTPEGTPGSGNSNALSLSVPSAAGELVIAALVHLLASATPGAGFSPTSGTELLDDTVGTMSALLMEKVGQAATVISATAAAGQAAWAGLGFALRDAASDANAPSSVSNLVAIPSRAGGRIDLSFSNPGDPDYAHPIIRRRTDAFPTGPTDGTNVPYTGSVTPGGPGAQADTGLTNGQLYYYSVFAADVSLNVSAGVNVTAVAHKPPVPLSPADNSVVLPAPPFSCTLDTDNIRPGLPIHMVFGAAAERDPLDLNELLAPAKERSRVDPSRWFYTPSGGARTAFPATGVPASAAKPITVEYDSTITSPGQSDIHWAFGVDQV